MRLTALAFLICVSAALLGSLAPSYIISHGIRGLNAYAVTGSGSTATNENSIPVVSVSTRYDPDFPSLHVFGELQNNLGMPVNNVLLNLTFYDSYGNVTGNITGYPFLSFLRPSEKSAFDLAVHGNNAVGIANFSYYKISRSWEEVQDPKEGLLRLDVRNIILDSCEYYHLEGTVANLGRDTTTGIGISAAFYNKENQVVATAFTTIKGTVDPTKLAPYAFIIEKKILPHFAYYSLNVQSLDYSSAVPEEEDDDDTRVRSGKITVFTDSIFYEPGSGGIRIEGWVSGINEREGPLDRFVRISIIAPSGLVPYLATAPLSEDGRFTRLLDIPISKDLRGQVFRVSAEYSGLVAENTFSIGYGAEGPDPLSPCRLERDIDLSRLDVLSETDLYNNASDVSRYLSGNEVRLGSPLLLSTAAENRLSRLQPVTIIFEVFDSRDAAIFIYVGNWTLAPNSSDQVGIPWIPPGEGEYRIRSIAISNLDRPMVLSSPASLVVRVSE